MATDYAEKERVFIASLEADTGQPLAAWMDAIAGCGHTNRNDIIDWLRQSGFTFSNASWLERIHHNGGRLVYAEDVPQPMSPAPPRLAARAEAKGAAAKNPAAKPSPPLAPRPETEPPAETAAAAPPVRKPQPVLTVVPQAPPPNSEAVAAAPPAAVQLDAAASEVLAAAKGLRPLATLALQAISTSIPATQLSADGPLLILSAPHPFLALLPGAKALRFYGSFGPGKPERTARAEAIMKIASKAPPPYPSVLVLDDARLVDETFVALIRAALAEAIKNAPAEPALQAPPAIQGAAHT